MQKKRNVDNNIKRKKLFLDWMLQIQCGNVKQLFTPKMDIIACFDPSIHSGNLGDSIIQKYCRRVVDELYGTENIVLIQTHEMPGEPERKLAASAKRRFVFGTNIISTDLAKYSIWEFPRTLYGYNNTITMGVGAGRRDVAVSKLSTLVYRNLFSRKYIHSVRDSYTERLFHQMGIHNVLNTGCATLWGLTETHCSKIPISKAKNVITTITDYDRDPKNDRIMLEILKKEYDTVFLWLQGCEDYEYLDSLGELDSIVLLDHSLEAYESVLEKGGIDYVGTRLHAGIHALNYRIRSLIISIDNRAEDMGNDFSLPILKRECVENELITWIREDRKTELKLPWEKIETWKKQFASDAKK